MNFNVTMHFLNTPHFVNTAPPAIGAGAVIEAAFNYSDNAHICHFNLLDLTYLPRSLGSATSANPITPARTGCLPYKRRTIHGQAATQDNNSLATTSSQSMSPPRTRNEQHNDTPGASTSTTEAAFLLATGEYQEDIDDGNPLKRKADEETQENTPEESITTKDKRSKAKGSAMAMNTRSRTYIAPLFYTIP